MKCGHFTHNSMHVGDIKRGNPRSGWLLDSMVTIATTWHALTWGILASFFPERYNIILSVHPVFTRYQTFPVSIVFQPSCILSLSHLNVCMVPPRGCWDYITHWKHLCVYVLGSGRSNVWRCWELFKFKNAAWMWWTDGWWVWIKKILDSDVVENQDLLNVFTHAIRHEQMISVFNYRLIRAKMLFDFRELNFTWRLPNAILKECRC